MALAALRALALLLWGAAAAQAQTVGLVGVLGERALLIVDGAPPRALAGGESYKGVRLLSTQGDTAVVELAGRRVTLRMGEAPAQVGAGGADAGGKRVVLQAGSGGHFITDGQINGRSAPMVVDTGASVVGISQQQAERMGLDYRRGTPVQISTANGVIAGWQVRLDSVKVGDVLVYGVDSVVSAGAMPYVLLGNSFLSRFQMTRSDGQLVLEKRN